VIGISVLRTTERNYNSSIPMAFGPLAIFDKSFLQSLSLHESVWFDNFFRTIITPLFFAETLADLEKKVSSGKTPQQVVGKIAGKTPDMNSVPSVHHFNLIVSNLLGYPIEMRRRPIISGGVPKTSGTGYGLYFEEFPEVEALGRWQSNKFLEIEKDFAKSWRAALANPGFETDIRIAMNTIPSGQKFGNLAQIKLHIDTFLQNTSVEHLRLLFEIMAIPVKTHSRILKRWELEGKPKLIDFAPYSHFAFSIDLFFYISVGWGHIAKERASNKIDMAYLYYLPFSHILISNDNLHKRTAPLFMQPDQQFVTGDALKPDLKRLDEYYDLLPQAVKEKGIIKFATYPPQDTSTKIAELWDKYLPMWRKHANEKKTKSRSPKETDGDLLKHLKSLENAPPYNGPGPILSDEANSITITRNIRTRKGKWRTVPKEVEDMAIKDKK
jgi:hypothetical protein